MQITARFSSQCPACRQPIEVGRLVNWERGAKAVHVACPAPRVAIQPVKRIAVEDAGVYVLPDNTIVKAQANKDKTRTYAMKWVVIGGMRLTEAGTKEHGEYQYAPGLIEEVASVGRKMTLAEAKAFILRFGRCCRCNLKLKSADSVERGIGPVCVKYFSAGVTGADLMVTPAAVPSFQCEHGKSNHCTVDGVRLGAVA